MISNGFLALFDYLSFHVLLCLVPAFFIAGAMTVFIPKDLVIKYIGKDSPAYISYPVAAAAGFMLAVCSCTVLPLFAGIWKKGAGLGPAITFLFSAPAINLLAITYTGTLIGLDIAIARGILSISFAIIIGILMAAIFPNRAVIESPTDIIGETSAIREKITITNQSLFVLMLVIINIFVGILLSILNHDLLIAFGVRTGDTAIIQLLLWAIGVLCLVILSFIYKRRTILLFLWLVSILSTGTSQISFFFAGVDLQLLVIDSNVANIGIKTLLTAIVAAGTVIYANKSFNHEEKMDWLRETKFFFLKIFPYIIIGVFLAGMLRILIPDQLVLELVGRNSLFANAIGVFFGIFMYFPTLMEVPVARMFLDKGMVRGVLLAYLLADPELSIQSILVIRKFIGDHKTVTYVLLVAVFSIIAGLLFGFFVSGEIITLW